MRRLVLFIIFGGLVCVLLAYRKPSHVSRVEFYRPSAPLLPRVLPSVAPVQPATAKSVAPTSPQDLPSLVAQTQVWRLKVPSDLNEANSIRRMAQSLSNADLAQLSETVVNPQVEGDARWAALYLVTQNASRAQDYLNQIVQTDFPAAHKDSELGLRISALESLDQQAAARGGDWHEIFWQDTVNVKDPTLRLLTTVALRGVDQGRPGKLGRFIDHLLRPAKSDNPM